jgi:hypothetical protein
MTSSAPSSNPDDRLREALAAIGDAHGQPKWPDRDPDYVKLLDLTPDDIPALLSIIRPSFSPPFGAAEETDPEHDPCVDQAEVNAPIHAWRALAHLGAVQAIDELITWVDVADDLDDDWYLEEFVDVMALIGPDALSSLRNAMLDEDDSENDRITYANAIERIGRRHHGSRSRAIELLSGQLENFADNPRGLNGFLVSFLLNLKAESAAETIEQAFAGDYVDLSIAGNWNTVRRELGVEGTGLVPAGLANYQWVTTHEMYRSPGSWKPARPHGDPKRRQRSQRKKQRQNRRRGRR